MKCRLTRNTLFWTACLGLAVGIFLGKNFIRTYETDFQFKPSFANSDMSETLTEQKAKIHHNHSNANENRVIADRLYKEVRILCWIMTGTANHKTKAYHVYKTWGRRCNRLIFMSSSTKNGTIGMEFVALDVKEGRDELFHKTKLAFKYVYENHLNEYDWFMKADDDTYVVLENLRYLLYPYSPETPVYFGHRFNAFQKEGYMSGGAGYVLSRGALKAFVKKSMNDGSLCRRDGRGAEDIEFAKCLVNVGVQSGDSRDWTTLQGKFFPFAAHSHLQMTIIDKKYWFWKFQYYEPTVGRQCCSDRAIAYHYIRPDEMYLYDYMIYHLRPYGVSEEVPVLPKKLKVDEKGWNTIVDVTKLEFV